MASYQKSVESAFKQIKGLAPSQKIAVLLGALLVAGSLAWMAQWAATSEMVPLVNQTLTTEDAAQIASGLETIGEPHKLDGTALLVRADANRAALWAQLGLMDKMPGDTSIGFAEMVKEANPWLPQEENAKRWTLAVQTALERMLKQINGVKDAKVLLNLNGRERGFSRNQAESKASVLLVTRDSEPVSRELAIAAARLVSGAVRGLPLKNVEVVDGAGRSALRWDEDDTSGAPGLAHLQRQVERETAAKISDQLRFDRNVRVNVQVVLDRAAKTESASTPIEGVVTEEISTEQTASRARPGGQPGVEVNTGAVAAGSGGDGESTSDLHKEARYQPGVSNTTTSNPAGTVKQVFAAIALSHSYLENVFRKKNPDAKASTEADIQKIFEEQKARVENQVAKLVLPTDAKQVAVDWYYDAPLSAESAPSSGSVEASFDMARRYGPGAALGLLALVSLGLVMRMAKPRSTDEALGLELGLPREAIEAARRAAADLSAPIPSPAAAAGQSASDAPDAGAAPAAATPVPFGTAVEGVLDAQEVDDGTMQIQKMIEQVGRLADEDDESMAQLLENWVDRARL